MAHTDSGPYTKLSLEEGDLSRRQESWTEASLCMFLAVWPGADDLIPLACLCTIVWSLAQASQRPFFLHYLCTKQLI
jgi:hypothetical protein